MPAETSFAKIKYAIAADETKAFPAEVSEPGAKTIDKYLEEHTLTIKKYAGPATLKSGELALQEKTGETLTLPAAGTANQLIGITSIVTEVKIATTGGAEIWRGGAKVGSTALGMGQSIIVQSNGTHWQVVGEEGGVHLTAQATTPAFLSWGFINAAGEIKASSGDFTMAKTGEGIYELKWTKEKVATEYPCLVTNFGTNPGLAVTSSTEMTAKTVTFRIYVGKSGAEMGVAKNEPFSFVILAAN